MIAHFDVDAFYASVAVRDDPTLRGKPLAIAGASRRAVVLTASYEARPYGVRSAMPLYKALQACPDLVVVRPEMQKYRGISREIFAIFGRRGHTVEGLSMDEAFVDLASAGVDEAVGIARAMREEVHNEVGLTVSAGISTGKMVAKILSDSCKPDGLQVLRPGEEAGFLEPLPAGRLWGIGPKTQARLAQRGIVTIGDVARLDDAALRSLFGSWGNELRDLARGIDTRRVDSTRDTRSISTEETFEYDVRDERVLLELLREQASELAVKLEKEGLLARTIGVKIKRGDFSVFGRQTNLAEPTMESATIYEAAAYCLYRAALHNEPVRLLGTRAASLELAGARQATLFER
ncbi:MAG: DNA polymerase IV [Candidatus Eremiobacteraeota bacterium]|nr:DNA polymerase IV [Candidatus Eremiobacteraeota bacterium]